MGVDGVDVNIVNRYKYTEASKGGRPNRSIQQHYV